MSDMPERDLELACARELGERLGRPFETLAEKAARLEAEQGPQAGSTTSVWRVEAGCDGQWRPVGSPIGERAKAVEALEWYRSLAGPSVAHRLVRDDTTHSTTVEEA